MVVNSCREYLEGRMRLKRVWKLVPQAGKKKNKLVVLSSGWEFWHFHYEGVAGGLHVSYRYLGGRGGAMQEEGRGYKTRMEAEEDRAMTK